MYDLICTYSDVTGKNTVCRKHCDTYEDAGAGFETYISLEYQNKL